MKRHIPTIFVVALLSAAPCFGAQWTISEESADHTSTSLGNISSVERSPNGCISNVHYENNGHPGVYKIYYGDQNADDGCFNPPFDEDVSLLQTGLRDLPHPYQIIMKPTPWSYVNSEKMIFQDQVTKKTMNIDEFEGMVRGFEIKKNEAAGNYSGHPVDEFVNWTKGIHPFSDARVSQQKDLKKDDVVVGSGQTAAPVGAGVITVPTKQ
jgi:hypothetical protein